MSSLAHPSADGVETQLVSWPLLQLLTQRVPFSSLIFRTEVMFKFQLFVMDLGAGSEVSSRSLPSMVFNITCDFIVSFLKK